MTECILAYVVSVILCCCAFKYALGYLSVATLMLSIAVSLISFLGITSPENARLFVAFTPSYAAILTMIVTFAVEHDKKLF